MTKQIAGLIFFGAAMGFMAATVYLANQRGQTCPEVAARLLRVAGAALGRVKAVAAGLVVAGIGLYDVITGGGIDLTHILEPIIGDKIDVGRALSTIALLVTIARFIMQSGMFKSNNRNGLDNPDEPDLASAAK